MSNTYVAVWTSWIGWSKAGILLDSDRAAKRGPPTHIVALLASSPDVVNGHMLTYTVQGKQTQVSESLACFSAVSVWMEFWYWAMHFLGSKDIISTTIKGTVCMTWHGVSGMVIGCGYCTNVLDVCHPCLLLLNRISNGHKRFGGTSQGKPTPMLRSRFVCVCLWTFYARKLQNVVVRCETVMAIGQSLETESRIDV